MQHRDHACTRRVSILTESLEGLRQRKMKLCLPIMIAGQASMRSTPPMEHFILAVLPEHDYRQPRVDGSERRAACAATRGMSGAGAERFACRIGC